MRMLFDHEDLTKLAYAWLRSKGHEPDEDAGVSWYNDEGELLDISPEMDVPLKDGPLEAKASGDPAGRGR